MPLPVPARALNAAFVSAVLLFGAWLRLARLALPSFWLDEILGYDIATTAARQPLWRWLSVFEIEHGPLFHATELAGRFLPTPETAARIAPALFGIATIAVAWFTARTAPVTASGGQRPSAVRTAEGGCPPRCLREATAYVFAILIAASPLHVYYSREARPYALALLLTTALLALLLRRARLRYVIPLMLLIAYTSATTFPLLISVVIAAVAAYWGQRPWRAAGAAAAIAALMPLLYRGAGAQPMGIGFPKITIHLLRSVLDSFSASAIDTMHEHRVALVFLLFAVIGAIDTLRRDRARGLVVVAFATLPAAIALVALWHLDHFYAVRYLANALPGYLLLVACGVAAIAERLSKRFAAVIAVLAAALLVGEGLPAAREEPFQRLDWRTIARTLAGHAHENDAVIAANDWTAVCLGFYLRGLTPHVRLFNARGSPVMGEVFAYQNTTSWLVVGGNDASPFAAWACRFPVVLASPFERFRLHYCPDAYHFLTDRSTPAEHRALLNSFVSQAPALHFGPGEDVFFGDGWGSAEPEEGRYARWALGRRAMIALPLDAPADRVIGVELSPLWYPGARQQRLSIAINDQPLGNLLLGSGRMRYAIHAPRAFWRTGVNRLALEFDHATAPAHVDPRSSDHRPLAARFYEFSVGGAAGGPSPDGVHLIRLDEGGTYIDETSAWPAEGGRALPRDIDRGKLAQFTGRLGFDADRAIPLLMSGRITLANLAASLADQSSCTDDERFLRTLFLALLGRSIGDGELRRFGAELRRGVSRAKIVRDLANSEEVRGEASGVGRQGFRGRMGLATRADSRSAPLLQRPNGQLQRTCCLAEVRRSRSGNLHCDKGISAR